MSEYKDMFAGNTAEDMNPVFDMETAINTLDIAADVAVEKINSMSATIEKKEVDKSLISIAKEEFGKLLSLVETNPRIGSAIYYGGVGACIALLLTGHSVEIPDMVANPSDIDIAIWGNAVNEALGGTAQFIAAAMVAISGQELQTREEKAVKSAEN